MFATNASIYEEQKVKLLSSVTAGMSVGWNMSMMFSEVQNLSYRMFLYYLEKIADNHDQILNPNKQR